MLHGSCVAIARRATGSALADVAPRRGIDERGRAAELAGPRRFRDETGVLELPHDGTDLCRGNVRLDGEARDGKPRPHQLAAYGQARVPDVHVPECRMAGSVPGGCP